VTLPFPRFEKIKIIIQLKLQLMHIIWLFNPLCPTSGRRLWTPPNLTQ
jgi:hypothetical protein